MNISQTYYKCPYCGSSNIVFDEELQSYVCVSCGTVLENHPLDYGFELRSFDNKLPRTSGSSTNKVHDHGIGSTEISIEYGKNRYKWRNMRKIQKSIRVDKSERIVEKALRYMNKYSKILNAPNYVVETAGWILKETVKGKNYKNKTLKNIAIAAIYIAYKIHGIKKPAKLYSREAGITLKELWHAEKEIHNAIKDLNKRMKREDPIRYITYIVEKLNLPPEVEKLAITLLNESRKIGLDIGRAGIGLATASVYLASILLNHKRTQLDIAKTVNVTDVTIRNRYSDIIDSFDITVYL